MPRKILSSTARPSCLAAVADTSISCSLSGLGANRYVEHSKAGVMCLRWKAGVCGAMETVVKLAASRINFNQRAHLARDML